MTGTTPFLDLPLDQLLIPTHLTYDDILERHGATAGIPDPKHLDALASDLRTLAGLAEARGQMCDRGMRELSKRRKERIEQEREKEREVRERRERMEQVQQDALLASLEAAAREKKVTPSTTTISKDTKATPSETTVSKEAPDGRGGRETRPPTHGAHGLARQDGLDNTTKDPKTSPVISRPSTEDDIPPLDIKREATSTSISSLSPSPRPVSPTTLVAKDIYGAPGSPASTQSLLAERQPEPAPAVPQYQTFGPDPSTFDDLTVYHVRPVLPGMAEEEILEIYSVAQYPHDDLHGLIPGTPPDRDLSNAKPPNQVAASTFATWVEPYFRTTSEEDLAFLRERGDRTDAFVIPRRGKRHYSEAWAEEDGLTLAEQIPQHARNLPANQGRGSVEQVNDEIAETDQVSTGPMLSRLLSAMRPEARPPPPPLLEENEKPSSADGGANMDVVMGGMNGEANGDNFVHDGELDKPDKPNKPATLPPATFIPDSMQPNWKPSPTKLDHSQVDERLKQELRYIGFLGDDAEPDYDAHYDDALAARIRLLQAQLKEQAIVNGARKTRVDELARERLAHQEWANILEDLDNQVQQSYLKRSRILGKGKKQQKRPGGAGGGCHFVGSATPGVSRPGIGDLAKTVMERRKKWIDLVALFDENFTKIPKESIFASAVVAPLLAKEREAWEEGDDE
ncbi:MAG: Transcriptional regulator [Phylliscum demangeonii]|nr:MAG: Transcriptional regulator [Phylliscum demangeonii]